MLFQFVILVVGNDITAVSVPVWPPGVQHVLCWVGQGVFFSFFPSKATSPTKFAAVKHQTMVDNVRAILQVFRADG